MFVAAALASMLTFVPSLYSDEDQMCYEEMSIDYSIYYDEPTEGYEMGERLKFLCSTIPYQKESGDYYCLETHAADAFNQMANAAFESKFKVKVNSAFRTKWEQYRLRRKFGDLAAKVGWSNHQSGTAVDIAGTMAFVPEWKIKPEHFSKKYCQADNKHGVFGYHCPTRLFWWLKRNAPKFGFFNTVDGEPWHWDYLGVKPSETLVSR